MLFLLGEINTDFKYQKPAKKLNLYKLFNLTCNSIIYISRVFKYYSSCVPGTYKKYLILYCKESETKKFFDFEQ